MHVAPINNQKEQIVLLLIGSFIAGMLTVLAPCVLPLLPVIIGGSVSGDKKDIRRPFIITASLALSLILFTLLLKATTLLIDIPPQSIEYVSGAIIIAIGVIGLFPIVYEKLISKLGIQSKSQRLLGKGTQAKNGILGPVIIGAALGPVFSSCSPVYAYILATILPASFAQAFVYILAYVLGLSIVLLAIGVLGQRFVHKLSWASNPRGWFQRGIAILFILVGLLVFTGTAKDVQTWVSRNTPFDFDGLSSKLIPGSGAETTGDALNVKEPYQAPEFKNLQNWINSDPLTAQDLRGKVTLIDFWTYSCINCIRTQPYLKGWYQTYSQSDFQIIGMHAPEFAFERNPENVRRAAEDADLTYPIALDNDFATWNNYGVRFWPSMFLVDAEGNVRRIHYGEGEYEQTEDAIRALLSQAGKSVPPQRFVGEDATVPVTQNQTPETYLGSKRSANYVGPTRFFAGQTERFKPAENLANNQWTLGGSWRVESELITALSPSTLRFRISAKDVYLVASSEKSQQITVLIDGKPIGQTSSSGSDIEDSLLTIQEAKLYTIVSHDQYQDSFEIELQVPAGASLSVFTFGS
jgi:cytochrome c biogenesis protein CcdA/thiol-disulfide isomerase/thioredoxin